MSEKHEESPQPPPVAVARTGHSNVVYGEKVQKLDYSLPVSGSLSRVRTKQ